VAVLVERMSRAVLLAKMPDATAASALAAFTTKLQSLVAPLRQTLTCDQGREMSRHAELTAATGVRVYFCDPHSPWQRGTCENTNGLLRQYLPKGTDLSVYSQEELDANSRQPQHPTPPNLGLALALAGARGNPRQPPRFLSRPLTQSVLHFALETALLEEMTIVESMPNEALQWDAPHSART